MHNLLDSNFKWTFFIHFAILALIPGHNVNQVLFNQARKHCQPGILPINCPVGALAKRIQLSFVQNQRKIVRFCI